jgi:hypothetical protein
VRQVGYLPELYEDARSDKYKTLQLKFNVKCKKSYLYITFLSNGMRSHKRWGSVACHKGMDWGIEAWLHLFLTLALDEGKCLASCPSHCVTGERASGTH